MRQADPHFGAARECTADQQCGRSQRRLDRHPRTEAQSELGHPCRQVLVAGMNQDQGAEFSRDGKESVQAGMAELGIADPATDFDTQKASLAHTPAQFVDGPVGVLQGYGAQCSEPGWVPTGDPGEEFVLRRGKFSRACRRGPIAERHRDRRKQLHGNAVTIHIAEPGRWRPASVVDPAVMLSAEQEVCFGLAGPLDARPEVVRIAVQQIRQTIVDGVRVHVDKSCAGGCLSVDGGSAQQVRRTGSIEDSYCAYIIQDVHA